MKTCVEYTFLPVTLSPSVALNTPVGSFSFLLSALFSCLQWKNVWAPCRWARRWWSYAVAPRDWCASSIWTNTSPASAGGPHARMRRLRVSQLYLINYKGTAFQICLCRSDGLKWERIESHLCHIFMQELIFIFCISICRLFKRVNWAGPRQKEADNEQTWQLTVNQTRAFHYNDPEMVLTDFGFQVDI